MVISFPWIRNAIFSSCIEYLQAVGIFSWNILAKANFFNKFYNPMDRKHVSPLTRTKEISVMRRDLQIHKNSKSYHNPEVQE